MTEARSCRAELLMLPPAAAHALGMSGLTVGHGRTRIIASTELPRQLSSLLPAVAIEVE